MNQPISQTLEQAISRLQRLKEAPPSTDFKSVDAITCYVCHSVREVPSTYPRGGNSVEKCNKCRTHECLVKFTETCPKLYQDTNPALLPKAQLEQAMRWSFNSRGLALVGDTGKGKTRIAWHLIKRVLTEDSGMLERSFVWFDCVGFGHAIAKHYKTEDAEEWLEKIASKDLLFFDDLGKLKLTERAETELFGVIERRCANQLPIIATTNDSGDSLAARMTENRGPALIRRLREFCEVISF